MNSGIIKKSIGLVGMLIFTLGGVCFGEDLELKDEEIVPGSTINAPSHVNVRGEHACVRIIATDIDLTAGTSISSAGLLLAGNDINLKYGTELENTGTIIAGGDVYINGQKVESSGNYDKGLVQVNLANKITSALFAGKFHYVEEFLPKGFWCSGKYMVSLDEQQIQQVRLLLLNHQTSEKKYSILMNAVAKGRVDVVKWLLEQGVDVNLQDADGDTAAHWTILNKENQIEAFKLIISHPDFDPSIKGGKGLDVLELARIHSNPEFLNLLSAKMNIDKQSE